MLVLTIIGIAATTNTQIELQIAGNDKVHKKTFYSAEAGAVLATEVLEQAFRCSTGFLETDATLKVADLEGTIRVFEGDATSPYILWNNHVFKDSTDGDYDTNLHRPFTDVGSIAQADVAYPVTNLASGEETGYLYFGGETQMLPGGALQMAAGYEGRGKSAAQGGVSKLFDIYSMFHGLVNSETIILLGWRHLVGTEGDCNYD